MWNSASRKQYEKFRRLVRLSKCTDDSNELARGYHQSYAAILMKDGFTSAAAIAAIPLASFVARVQHGIPEMDAVAIYEHATSTYETRAITSYEAVQGTGLAAIEGSVSTREKIEMVKETGETLADFGLERLFGDMDREVCDDCNSFTSPAAYFVETLQFLRSNNLDSDLKYDGQERIYGTALECLLARRPDLKRLELTCINTKAVIPYLDLVNEIMESFVVYLWDHSHPQFKRTSKGGTIHPYQNPSPICGEISTPLQTINDDAYSILSEAMCPFNKLPYHQPLDEIRIFLKHLKTSRHELLDVFRRAFQAGTILAKDKETASSKESYVAAQGRAVTAEYLSLTESEYIGLTGEDYLANKYDLIKDDGSALSEESGVPVRLHAWWQFWGYKKKSEALQLKTGPEVIKTEFLRRTRLKSSDLADLLKTEFVNPHVPRGNGLAILESNQFGFVSLGDLKFKGASIEDPVVRYKALINFMAAQQTKSTSISRCGEFSRKQIEEWVKANHATFHKIIVLDNPHMLEGWHVSPARLTHLNEERLNPTELLRIQQFVRLRAKMGWTIDELDRAISALSRYQSGKSHSDASTTTPVITTKLLDQLVCVSKLLGMTDLELPNLLTFWSTISTRGEASLYTRLFLTHQFIFTDPVFLPDEHGHYFTKSERLSAHASIIMASLGLTKNSFEALMNAELYSKGSLAQQDISIESLSFLYRHKLMAQVLHISPTNLCEVIGVFGNIFDSPSQTLDFLVQWKRMADVGISFEHLNYVIKGVEDPLNPVGLSRPKILGAIKALLDGIDVIHTMHPDIEEEEHDTLTKESITAKLSLIYDKSQVKEIHEFLEGKTVEWVEGKLPSWLGLTLGFINESEKKTFYAFDSTLGKKHFYFLRSLIPYLRQQLIERLVISVMSSELCIPSEMTRMLLTDIVRVKHGAGDHGDGSAEVSALKAMSNIRLLGDKQDKALFEGHLVPGSDELYMFVNPPQTKSTVQIDELKVASSAGQIYLEGGRAYQLRVTNDADGKFQWKTHSSPLHALPEVVLLPHYAEERLTPIFTQLAKIALIVNNCKLSTDEVKYMARYPQGTPILQYGRLSFEGWRQLLNYLGLRNGLHNAPGKELIHLFRWASNPDDMEANPRDKTLSERLARLMHVKQSTVKRLLAHFSLNQRGSFKSWANFIKLKKAYDLAQKVDIDVDSLFSWAEPLGEFEHARKLAHRIQGTIKARYTAKDWEKVAKPLRHELRSNQRDALIGYLLNQPEIINWRVFDAKSLFGFFLIDPQMGPCLDASRIKQAISTVQLFIQRCLCGQEEAFGVPVRTLDRKRWEWMKCYHAWETNRKIFLYPENWIEPSLRDDKSSVFQAFETDIIQSDMHPQSIQDAVKRYISRLDEVANLHVVSVCSDTETNTVHIFARTRGAPYFYYYRSYNLMEGTWKPWDKMQLDIPHYEDNELNSANHGGTFLKPVIWMGRLIVFLPRFVKRIGGGKLAGLETCMSDEPGEKSSLEPTNYEYWELKVGWTEYQNGRWTPKQTTSKAFRTQSGPEGVGTLRECVFTTTFCNDDLYLTAQIEKRRTAWFRLSKGQFDSVEATDLLSQEYATAAPLLTSSKPGIHREFGTIVDKDIVCVSTVDPSVNNVHPCPNNMHQCPNTVHPCLHLTDRPPTTIEYNRRNPTSAVFLAPPDYQAPFYHEFSGHLLRHTNTSNTLDDLYGGFSLEVSRFKNNALGHAGAPLGLDICMTYPNYHELKSPYSLYNWELGLHIPMLLMDKLRSCHQYEQALKIAHYVFDPMSHHLKEYGNEYCTKDDGGHTEIDYPKRSCVWKWTPFKEISAQNVLGRLLNSLKASPPGKAGGQGQINGSRDAPLHPHVIARSRTVVYMKWFVMSYINILLEFGDQHFRQNTSESVSQAFQYYTLAAHLCGSPKEKVQKRGKKHPETYDSLVKKSRIVGDADMNWQTTFPFTHSTSTIQTTVTVTAPTLLDGDVSLYFCVPENDKLKNLRAKIDDRLFKIQHCQNARGLSLCKFDLLAPQVDASALVHATSQGLSIQSILQGLNAPMPNYRFKYILEKAFEMVHELKSLGNAFLEAMVRKDSETYNLIRAGHETSINSMLLGMKKLSLEEANKALVSLQEARKGPMSQLEHLYRLLGESDKISPLEGEEFKELTAPIIEIDQHSGYKLTAFEAAEIGTAEQGTEYIEKRNTAETASALLLGHPTMATSATKMPHVMGHQVRFDSLNLGEAASAYARAMEAQMELLQSQSMGAARKSSLLRQYQDRIQQANSVGYEIKHIDSQIEEQKVRIKITNRDIELQQKRLELMARSEHFLRTKYTNQDLCIWREKQLRDLYHQTYIIAYDLAKKAESSFQFERGPANSFDFEHGPAITNFIQGTWDTNKDGLFSGEQLHLGLKRLEMAYNENRGYDYEITKHISLKQLHPRAFLELRELGNCEFDIPEVIFDMDFPGHYKRRIKAVSLTFHPQPKQPAATSLFSVNCTMRLVRHSYRVKVATDRDSYAKGNVGGDNESFHTDVIPIDHIATSNGLNDGGVARSSTGMDERYLPFEGAGAISRWKLELPPHYRAFDYRKVPDATVHIRYTSVYGGDTLKRIAGEYVDWYLAGIRASRGGAFALFDIRQDFGNELKTATDTNSMTITMANLENNLPFFANRNYTKAIVVKEIHIFTNSNINEATRWKITVPNGTTTKDIAFKGPTGRGLRCFSSGEVDCPFGTWTLSLGKSEKGDNLRDIWVVGHYTVVRR